jgi:murein tripeptide amidase MpaA
MPLPPGVTFLSPTVPVYVFESNKPGPTALIQAGIHGDEIAGVHALQEILEGELRPDRGRLLLIPVMNVAAYRARERTAPGGLDLNRCFPGSPGAPDVERRLAHGFMNLARTEKPALLATLHESWKRHHPEIDVSFGQSIVYGTHEMPAIIPDVVARLNEDLAHPYEKWSPHYYPVSTSSTDVIVDDIGCVGLCIETWMGFEETRRVEMHKRVVELLLQHVGILRGR